MSDKPRHVHTQNEMLKKVLILESHLCVVLLNVTKYLHALRCVYTIYSCTVVCFEMGTSSYSLFVLARYYRHGS